MYGACRILSSLKSEGVGALQSRWRPGDQVFEAIAARCNPDDMAETTREIKWVLKSGFTGDLMNAIVCLHQHAARGADPKVGNIAGGRMGDVLFPVAAKRRRRKTMAAGQRFKIILHKRILSDLFADQVDDVLATRWSLTVGLGEMCFK